MSEETRMEDNQPESTAETLTDLLQAGHRSRMNGTVLQGLNMNNVQFHQVMPDESCESCQNMQETNNTEPSMPESYLNYAAQLLEQMRGVYSTSWDNCANGTTWHGGHNHFYNPCSGADVPPSQSCPVYDCTNTCGCGSSPQPAPYPPMHEHTCHGGTATYYDDCAYKLQKISDQLNRIETMTSEMYTINQQLFSYLIEYYNTAITKSK